MEGLHERQSPGRLSNVIPPAGEAAYGPHAKARHVVPSAQGGWQRAPRSDGGALTF